ncbi:hypothetical protein AA313_de0202669 [Arthrobotrys entomopaga]|nr:hypothetical protein AA313_de0202669 [Arthrobotrys entomopaga]
MASRQVWDALGKGDIMSLVDLPQFCGINDNKPLNIAISAEEYWRWFTDGTNAGDEEIHKNEPEETIARRLWLLYTMNIRMYIVFQEPSINLQITRAVTEGLTGVLGDRLCLLRDLVKYMAIPYHVVKGSSLLDCVRLQRDGLVDAVFTDDSNAILHGATKVIRPVRFADCQKCKGKLDEVSRMVRAGIFPPGQDIDPNHVHFYNMAKIFSSISLSRETLIMLALLDTDGNPYITRECLVKKIEKIDRDPRNHHTIRDCLTASQLKDTLQEISRKIVVSGFDIGRTNILIPWKKFNPFLKPIYPRVISPGYRAGTCCRPWDEPLHEYRLREFHFGTFGTSTADFVSSYGAGILARKLMLGTDEDRRLICQSEGLDLRISPKQSNLSLVNLEFKPYWATSVSDDLALYHESHNRITKSMKRETCQIKFAKSLIEPHLSLEQKRQWSDALSKASLAGRKRSRPDDEGANYDLNPRLAKQSVNMAMFSQMTNSIKLMVEQAVQLHKAIQGQEQAQEKGNCSQLQHHTPPPTSFSDVTLPTPSPTPQGSPRTLVITPSEPISRSSAKYFRDCRSTASREGAAASDNPSFPPLYATPTPKRAVITHPQSPAAPLRSTISFAVEIPPAGHRRNPILLD